MLVFLLVIAPFVAGVVHDGFMESHLPTVILNGEPRLIARRIWRGHTIDEVSQRFHQNEPYHRDPVNVNFGDNPVQGRRVTVYRRVLRPAKLVFSGGDAVTHQWVGANDDYERQEFFRAPHALAFDEFERNI